MTKMPHQNMTEFYWSAARPTRHGYHTNKTK